MKENRRALLTVQGLSMLGQGLIGIFFPFFVQENFGLEIWQTIGWFALLQIAFGLLVFPINYWGVNSLGARKMIRIGLCFAALFYIILGLELASPLMFWVLNFCFVCFLAFFWPSYHFLTIQATKDKTRGNYLGNFQALSVGVGLVAPVLTGFLLEIDKAQYILGVAVACFVGAMMWTQLLPPTHAKVHPWSTSRKMIDEVFFKTGRYWGFLAESMIDITMWILWPIYFKAVVGTYTVMGAVTSFTAFLEIFTSKYIGKKTDKVGARKMLKLGCWTRCADLCLRAVYMKFSTLPAVVGIQALGSVLGPVSQISIENLIYDRGEEQKDKELDFMIIREIFLGIARGLFLIPVIVLACYLEPLWLGVVFIIAGLSAFGFRKL